MSGVGYLQTLVRGISHVTAVPVHGLGDRVLFNGNEYTYVYNKGTTAPVGYGMSLSASTNYSATISATTDVDECFGVVKHVAIPSGEYGWIATKGFAPVIAGLNTGLALGDKVILVSTSNTGNISRKTAHTAYSQLVGQPTPFGNVVQAAATAAEGTIYIYGR